MMSDVVINQRGKRKKNTCLYSVRCSKLLFMEVSRETGRICLVLSLLCSHIVVASTGNNHHDPFNYSPPMLSS